jgi:N-acetylglucosamine-6-phosphate deacetylase
MPQLGHRTPGLVGAALGDARLVAGVIVDGHHVHPAAVRTAWNALRPNRFMLVSDSTAALGLPPGPSVLGEQRVLLEGDVVRLADGSGTLAGSAVGLDHCVRTLVAVTGCDPAEAFVAATRAPADLLGRPDLGRLDVGAAADVALWSPDLTLAGLVLAGRPVSPSAGRTPSAAGPRS